MIPFHPAPSRPRARSDGSDGKEDMETAPEIERKYTPTSSNDDKGHFDLVLKVYEGGVRRVELS